MLTDRAYDGRGYPSNVLRKTSRSASPSVSISKIPTSNAFALDSMNS